MKLLISKYTLKKAIETSKESEPKLTSFSGTHAKPQNENVELFLFRFLFLSKFETCINYNSEKCK